MERPAANRRRHIGRDEGIDAALVLEHVVGPDGFSDDDTTLNPFKRLCMQPDFATFVADHDPLAICKPQTVHIVWMDEKLWPPFLFD